MVTMANVSIKRFLAPLRHYVSLKGVRSMKLEDDNTLKTSNTISGDWWDEGGIFKPLHSMNQLRVPFIRDNLLLTSANTRKVESLEGFKILDVGSGGGILSEPLANLGASVLGIDTMENIRLANKHASHYPHIKERLKYQSCKIEHLAQESANYFDGCVASEVIEHVDDVEGFVKACTECLKPGGLLFFTTINKTWLSKIFAIKVAEDILKLLPKGIHEWDKFVAPETLKSVLEMNGCSVRKIHGMLYNPLTNRWSWSKFTRINYALCAQKQTHD